MIDADKARDMSVKGQLNKESKQVADYLFVIEEKICQAAERGEWICEFSFKGSGLNSQVVMAIIAEIKKHMFTISYMDDDRLEFMLSW